MDRQPDSTDQRQNPFDTLVRRIGAAAMAVAAGLWLWAASLDVDGSVSAAQHQLERMGDLNRYGSAAAVVAAICAMILFLMKPATTRSGR